MEGDEIGNLNSEGSLSHIDIGTGITDFIVESPTQATINLESGRSNTTVVEGGAGDLSHHEGGVGTVDDIAIEVGIVDGGKRMLLAESFLTTQVGDIIRIVDSSNLKNERVLSIALNANEGLEVGISSVADEVGKTKVGGKGNALGTLLTVG